MACSLADQGKARMLKPIKTVKKYMRRVGRLGKRETPVAWSENEDFIRRLWPDGTWQLPIDPGIDVSERVWDVWDGKTWVGVRRETTEQRIAKRNAEMDQCARWIILDTHALEEEIRQTAAFPHLKGRLQYLEMTTIQHGWLPSLAAMKQLRDRLDLDEKAVGHVADQLRAMGKLRA